MATDYTDEDGSTAEYVAYRRKSRKAGYRHSTQPVCIRQAASRRPVPPLAAGKCEYSYYEDDDDDDCTDLDSSCCTDDLICSDESEECTEDSECSDDSECSEDDTDDSGVKCCRDVQPHWCFGGPCCKQHECPPEPKQDKKKKKKPKKKKKKPKKKKETCCMDQQKKPPKKKSSKKAGPACCMLDQGTKRPKNSCPGLCITFPTAPLCEPSETSSYKSEAESEVCPPRCPPEPCQPSPPHCPPEPCHSIHPHCPPEPCHPSHLHCSPQPCHPSHLHCPPDPCHPSHPHCPPEPCHPSHLHCPPDPCHSMCHPPKGYWVRGACANEPPRFVHDPHVTSWCHKPCRKSCHDNLLLPPWVEEPSITSLPFDQPGHGGCKWPTVHGCRPCGVRPYPRALAQRYNWLQALAMRQAHCRQMQPHCCPKNYEKCENSDCEDEYDDDEDDCEYDGDDCEYDDDDCEYDDDVSCRSSHC